MNPATSKTPPFFRAKNYRGVTVASSVDILPIRLDYPGQKWIAQRHEHGQIPTRGTYDHVATQEEVFGDHGAGHWWCKKTKPRFFKEWEAFLGDPDDIKILCECLASGESVSPKKNPESPDYASLKKKTDILTLGVAATGIGELIGFPLAHFRFVKLENQVAEIIGAVQHIPAVGLMCPKCGTPISYLLQPKCNSCQVSISWSVQSSSQPGSQQRKQWLP